MTSYSRMMVSGFLAGPGADAISSPIAVRFLILVFAAAFYVSKTMVRKTQHEQQGMRRRCLEAVVLVELPG